MFRLFAVGIAWSLVAFCSPAGADDKEKDKPTVWVRTVEGIELKFEIGKQTAKYHVRSGTNVLTLTAKITTDNNNVVTSEVTAVETEGSIGDPPKKGDKFSFKWVVKGDTATLSELKGDKVEEAKAIVEGEYKLKK